MNGEPLWWPDLAAAGGPGTHEGRAQAVAAAMAGGTVFTLSRVEQLLLWSARRWRHGRFRWDQVEMEFRRQLPGIWADALLAWEEVMEQLHHYPASRPDIGNGCRSSLSADERTLLTLVATLQRPGQGRLSPGLLLARLVPPAGRRDLLPSLLALATSLSMAGVQMPLHAAPPMLPARPFALPPVTDPVTGGVRDCAYR
ncbi:hypothetical protein [Niveispirillum fermenti]|uniref:hypothetical protein n=1 Tax=Niveispirillum fermenti TaxID=1233113 RepID=UPI003A8BCAD8